VGLSGCAAAPEGELLIKSNAANAPEKEVAFSGIGVSR